MRKEAESTKSAPAEFIQSRTFHCRSGGRLCFCLRHVLCEAGQAHGKTPFGLTAYRLNWKLNSTPNRLASGFLTLSR